MSLPESIVVTWNDTILRSLETGTNEPSLRLGPPMVARLLAIIYSAAFQAWVPLSDTGKPLLPDGAARRPVAERTLAAKRVAISYAIYRTALNLFPSSLITPLLDAQMSELGLDINNVGTAGNTPEAIGNNAAKLVLASRANDGANQSGTQAGSAAPPNPYSDYTGYVPINPPALAFAATERRHIVDVGRWQPIAYVDPLSGSVRTPGFIAPHWQNVKPFALSSANQFRPTPPEHPNSQAFLDQSRYVIEVQRELTLEQKIIAEYWADGPRSWLPPGHWCEIAGEVSRAKLHNVDKDVSPSYS